MGWIILFATFTTINALCFAVDPAGNWFNGLVCGFMFAAAIDAVLAYRLARRMDREIAGD
jgi:hypothetical protein